VARFESSSYVSEYKNEARFDLTRNRPNLIAMERQRDFVFAYKGVRTCGGTEAFTRNGRIGKGFAFRFSFYRYANKLEERH
jgi:hypothetical protein